MSNMHILVIPYPAQGHIIPLLKFSEQLIKHGFRITFVMSEYNHKRILNASAVEGGVGDQIRLVSIPDGLTDEERTVPGKSSAAVLRVMPGKVEELIQQINGSGSKITCVLVDQSISWMLEIVEKHGIKRAAFCPAAAAMLVLGSSIPKLISNEIIDKNGISSAIKETCLSLENTVNTSRMGNPHVVVIPYPAQGHVIPLMELSQILIKHGIKITFVNTEFNHERIQNAVGKESDLEGQIRLVSIPDGMAAEDRNHMGKSAEASWNFMPGELKQLIEKINRTDDDIVTCILADMTVGKGLEVASELGIKGAALWPPAALLLALGITIPRLMDDGVIDENGTSLKNEMIQLSPDTPPMDPSKFVWLSIEDFNTQKIVFDIMLRNNRAADKTEWLLCNTTHDLEAGALSLVPNVLPIGPVSAYEGLGDIAVNFWPEDTTCMKWLDQQPPRSVIFMAFGSFTVIDQIQFRELALGLELTNRPFLWVVRPDIMKGEDEAYPEGFQNRVANRGRIVGWAPQRAVLSHPSIACFVSHCGWNSTMEGVSNGVPFLCWPYFADQFLNESYICDSWKVGLKLEKDRSGIIRREEIKCKVEELIGDESLKARALELKEKTMNSIKEGGSSDKNLKRFIEWVKT